MISVSGAMNRIVHPFTCSFISPIQDSLTLILPLTVLLPHTTVLPRPVAAPADVKAVVAVVVAPHVRAAAPPRTPARSPSLYLPPPCLGKGVAKAAVSAGRDVMAVAKARR